MPNTPYTKKRAVQFRGPTTSEDYNSRIEENYQDITLLYNQANLNQASINTGYTRFMKDQFAMSSLVNDLELRISALENSQNLIVFYHSDQVDNDLFVGKPPYEIPTANQCTLDAMYGNVTLPVIPGSSISKLSFSGQNSNPMVPSSLETAVVGGGADSGTAIIDTSPPELAISRTIGSIWQRNVIVPTPIYGGAQLTLYIKAPTGLFTTANANNITLNTFPSFSTDIIDVAYTTNAAPAMNDQDGYINFFPYQSGNSASVGRTAPGSWLGDVDYKAGFRNYYFDPVPITGLRIKLNQSDYYFDGTNYVYSYGASLIDLRYQKFVSMGQIIIRVDAPSGSTISEITNVTPQIFNVDPAVLPDVFSYEVIYETSTPGVYTSTPQAFSQKAWIKVTLNQTPNGGTPNLTGLYATYI